MVSHRYASIQQSSNKYSVTLHYVFILHYVLIKKHLLKTLKIEKTFKNIWQMRVQHDN